MYRISLLLAFGLISGGAPVSMAQTDVAPTPAGILDSAPFDRAIWGVLVLGPDSDVIFERNADRLFIPASSNKLVVSALASVLLDSTFTITTEVFGSSPVSGGVLDGDLVVFGRGDPTFSERCYGSDTTANVPCETMWSRMNALADSIAATGLTHVTGALIGDGSYFEPTMVHPGWQSYDLNWWYAAPVTGLGFNDNSLNVTWGPGGTVGAPAEISFEPDLGDFVFENRTRTGDSTEATTVDFFRGPGVHEIRAVGTVAVDRNPRTEYFSVADPNLFFARALRASLAERGVSFGGPTVSTTDPSTYAHLRSGTALAVIQSRPLADLIYPILQSSQNWFAEVLLKNLGARFGESGSWDAGIDLATRFLIDSVGIDSTAFQLHDGSGLAAANLITPRAFVQLLDFMADHPRNGPFMEALPRSAAETGSLRRRFVGTPLEGRVIAKTGSINHVATLNGYVTTDDGVIRFSVMVNNQAGGSAAAAGRIDEFLVALLE